MQLDFPRPTQYCLDTSFVVRLFESFPRDTHSSLWLKIEDAIKGKCHIICEVEKELKAKFPDEYAWCVAQGIPVENVDSMVFAEAQRIVSDFPAWIRPNTTELYFADPFLVAHAKIHGCVVTTAEKAEPSNKAKKEIKIPDVCDFYGGIDYIAQRNSDIEIVPINEFLRRLGIRN